MCLIDRNLPDFEKFQKAVGFRLTVKDRQKQKAFLVRFSSTRAFKVIQDTPQLVHIQQGQKCQK